MRPLCKGQSRAGQTLFSIAVSILANRIKVSLKGPRLSHISCPAERKSRSSLSLYRGGGRQPPTFPFTGGSSRRGIASVARLEA
jgi:hypothetical protein